MMTSITGLPATPEALQLDMPLQVSFEPRGDYEPLGWTDDEVRVLFFQQLRRKLNDVGIGLSPDLEELLEKVQPVLAGGAVPATYPESGRGSGQLPKDPTRGAATAAR